MKFVVELTEGAESDLADIHEFVGGTVAGCVRTNCWTVFKACSTNSETFPSAVNTRQNCLRSGSNSSGKSITSHTG